MICARSHEDFFGIDFSCLLVRRMLRTEISRARLMGSQAIGILMWTLLRPSSRKFGLQKISSDLRLKPAHRICAPILTTATSTFTSKSVLEADTLDYGERSWCMRLVL